MTERLDLRLKIVCIEPCGSDLDDATQDFVGKMVEATIATRYVPSPGGCCCYRKHAPRESKAPHIGVAPTQNKEH